MADFSADRSQSVKVKTVSSDPFVSIIGSVMFILNITPLINNFFLQI